MLIIQAEEERVVDNRMHDRFCEMRAAAGHPVKGEAACHQGRVP
jgi:lysophospholipase